MARARARSDGSLSIDAAWVASGYEREADDLASALLQPAQPAWVVCRSGATGQPSQVQIGNVGTQVLWAGLSAPGLYQFNVRVPDGLPNGDAPVFLHVAGWPTTQTFL